MRDLVIAAAWRKFLGSGWGLVICPIFGVYFSAGKGSAGDKIKAMEAAGVAMAPTPSEIGMTLQKVYSGKA